MVITIDISSTYAETMAFKGLHTHTVELPRMVLAYCYDDWIMYRSILTCRTITHNNHEEFGSCNIARLSTAEASIFWMRLDASLTTWRAAPEQEQQYRDASGNMPEDGSFAAA